MFYTRINKIKVERAVSTIINNDARPCRAFQIVDVQNPALQADEDGGIFSASCASLACGYEDNALRATGENMIVIRYNNDVVISYGDVSVN
jgi:hypothetical protein